MVNISWMITVDFPLILPQSFRKLNAFSEQC